MEVVKWVSENWATIASVIAQIIGVASIVVKLTPTLKDDAVLLPIVKFIGKYIALNVTVDESARPK
jgi:hypothetical protein